ncbi:hypothetical protein AK812_SmicGene5147 [Symbiodinium microadriaticum]|uniref:Uncharacterized protein n=1 Tax=Symbiodinium microadriaticum TaxID=2951 RepID=A0A1Q9EUC8_SYMMI|nr:hypothetical protein AK812_SmicGene5147 [Symbiodinium microadriaticum]
MQVHLPRHVYNVALEESLLLQAYRTLCGVYVGHQCPPVTTMSCRNDIMLLAKQHLDPSSYTALSQYAAMLSTKLSDAVVVEFPLPVGTCNAKASEAEQLAWHHLAEGSGSIWSSARAVVPLLPFDRDTRKFSQGFICTLGLMAKRGAHGLTRHTSGHPNVCRLLNKLVHAIRPSLRWSSLTLTLDNTCQPHMDAGNWVGESMAIGLSHHDAGGLWIASAEGRDFVEVGDTLYAGEVFPTSLALSFLAASNVHIRSACHLSHPPVPGPRQQPDRRAILEVLLTLAAYVRHKGATFGLLQMAIVTAVRSVGGQWGLVTLGGVVKANVVNDPLWQEPQLSLINAFFLVVPRVVIGLLRVLFFTAARAVLILLELCTLRDANIGLSPHRIDLDDMAIVSE